ncbi:hypothetical protein [Fusobacterium sp. PH5-44]|uniref:hypothetical protein n=1 Tax=unclassified Fusobacterium TaxID=2648384 RepID=UPI003D191ACB
MKLINQFIILLISTLLLVNMSYATVRISNSLFDSPKENNNLPQNKDPMSVFLAKLSDNGDMIVGTNVNLNIDDNFIQNTHGVDPTHPSIIFNLDPECMSAKSGDVTSFDMRIGIGLFRSVLQDTLDGNKKNIKKSKYEDIDQSSIKNPVTEDKYYTDDGYTIIVPTYKKGKEMNEYLVKMFVLPNLHDKTLSDFITTSEALRRIAYNPTLLEKYYIIIDNPDKYEKGKYLIFGFLDKKGKYDHTQTKGMYTFDRMRVGVLKIKIIKNGEE